MRILIVDDSKIILKMANDIIVSNNICDDVSTVNSGEKCLEIVEEEEFDIILLDIIMPGINGLDVLRELKKRNKLEKIKVLMFTSLSDRNALKTSFELGASDYISKPIEPVEFLARIKSSINEQELRNRLRTQITKTIKKNEELFNLYEKLKTTQAQLIHREKLAGVGQLAAGIAHEINNPLSYISSNIATLIQYVNDYKKTISIYEKMVSEIGHENIDEYFFEEIKNMNIEFVNDDIVELFSDIKDGVDRVKQIVKGIRFFSNIDSSNDVQPYDINEGIRNVLLITENKCKPDITVETNFSEVPEIKGYPAEINQSLLNIIMNSIQAIMKKDVQTNEKIIISTEYYDGFVICRIKDTGAGIEESLIKNIFDPFFTTKDIGEGTGIGLSIAYDVFVNKHKGNIDVNSKIDFGTEMIITLPVNNKANNESNN